MAPQPGVLYLPGRPSRSIIDTVLVINVEAGLSTGLQKSAAVLANSNKPRAQAEYRLKPTRARVVAFPLQEGRCLPTFGGGCGCSCGSGLGAVAKSLRHRAGATEKTWGTTFQEQSTFPVDIFFFFPTPTSTTLSLLWAYLQFGLTSPPCPPGIFIVRELFFFWLSSLCLSVLSF